MCTIAYNTIGGLSRSSFLPRKRPLRMKTDEDMPLAKTAKKNFVFALPKLPISNTVTTDKVRDKTVSSKDEEEQKLKCQLIQKDLSSFQRKLQRLNGVVSLAEQQYNTTKLTSCCSLCMRNLSDDGSVKQVLERMENTIASYEAALSNSKYERKVKRCLEQLSHISGKDMEQFSAMKRCDKENASELRKGMVITLREQKAQSLKQTTCVACGFEIEHIPSFLRDVDKSAGSLVSELKFHSKPSLRI